MTISMKEQSCQQFLTTKYVFSRVQGFGTKFVSAESASTR